MVDMTIAESKEGGRPKADANPHGKYDHMEPQRAMWFPHTGAKIGEIFCLQGRFVIDSSDGKGSPLLPNAFIRRKNKHGKK